MLHLPFPLQYMYILHITYMQMRDVTHLGEDLYAGALGLVAALDANGDGNLELREVNKDIELYQKMHVFGWTA